MRAKREEAIFFYAVTQVMFVVRKAFSYGQTARLEIQLIHIRHKVVTLVTFKDTKLILHPTKLILHPKRRCQTDNLVVLGDI